MYTTALSKLNRQIVYVFLFFLRPLTLSAQTEIYYDNGSVSALVGGSDYTQCVNFTDVPLNQQITSMRFYGGGGGSANQKSFSIKIYGGALGVGPILYQGSTYVGESQWYQLDFSNPLPTTIHETISITIVTADYFGVGEDNDGPSGHSYWKGSGGWQPRVQGDYMIRFTYEQAPDNSPPSITNITTNPASPVPNQEISIQAEISDVSGLSWARVYYRNFSLSAAFDSLDLVQGTGSSYSASIGAYPEGAEIDYYIGAADNSTDKHVSIADNGGSYYSIDFPEAGPSITGISHDPADPIMTEDIKVSASIEDPSDIGFAVVNSFSFEMTDLRTDTMTLDETERYYVFIGPYSPSDTVYYSILAADTLGNSTLDDNEGEYYSFVIHNDPPEITSPDTLHAWEDSLFSFSPEGSDPQLSMLEFTFDGVASWLTVSGQSVSGIPLTGTADTTLTVLASDGYLSSQKTFTILFHEVNDAPVITGHSNDLRLVEDTPRTLSLDDFTAEDEESDYPDGFTLSILDGDFYEVDGLTITPDPNFQDTLSVGVRVNDGERNSPVYLARIPVVPVNDPPVVDLLPDSNMSEDSTLTMVLSALDPDGDTLSFSAWADTGAVTCRVDSNYLEIAGALNWNGVAVIMVAAHDDISSDTACFRLVVEAVNDAPEAVTLLEPAAESTFLDTATIHFSWSTGTDVDGDSLSYALKFLAGDRDTIIFVPSTNFEVDLAEYEILETGSFGWTVAVSDGQELVWAAETRPATIQHYVGLGETAALPQTCSLEQNYPNPFNPTTTIRYGLPEAAHVTLTLYDIQGRRIQTLVNDARSAGWHSLQWDGRDANGEGLGTGTYFLRIQSGSFAEIIKLMLIK